MQEDNKNIGLFIAGIAVKILKARLNEAAGCLLGDHGDYSAVLSAAKRLECAENALERLSAEAGAASGAREKASEYIFS